MIDSTYDVMLGNPGDELFNVLVLAGIDVVMPLERDLDRDPLQDDEVSLQSLDGAYEQVLFSSDDDVAPDDDNRLLYYRFRLVPPGVYSVFVKTAGKASEIVRGLIVRRDGVYLGTKKLTEERSVKAFSAADEKAPAADELRDIEWKPEGPLDQGDD